MLVVNRVELIALDQPEQMRKLHRDHTASVEQLLHSRHKVIQRGNMRQHVVADQQVGFAMLSGDFLCCPFPEELHQRRDTFGLGYLGDVRGGLDTENRDLSAYKMLQQITVVAGYLHHLVTLAKVEALDHGNRILL